MKGKSSYLMLLSLLFPLAFNGQQKDLTKAPFECDLLKAYAAPIQGLKFERCEEPKELSQLMKTAYYTVSGKDHARIERFLREKYKMPKLVPFMGYYENEQGGSGRIREQQGEKRIPVCIGRKNVGYYEVRNRSENRSVYSRQQ